MLSRQGLRGCLSSGLLRYAAGAPQAAAAATLQLPATLQQHAAASTTTSSSSGSSSQASGRLPWLVGGVAAAGAAAAWSLPTSQAKARLAQDTKPAVTPDSLKKPAAQKAAESDAERQLPEYTAEEVAAHKTPEARVWVTFRGGVYDITDFVAAHPGGASKIMLAAGGSVEPFWGMYQLHHKQEVYDILAPFKIGTLKGAPLASKQALADPWVNEPARHPALVVRSVNPFNSETPPAILADAFLTPNDVHYKRNHLPVPDIKGEEYKLTIGGDGLRSMTLDLNDLKTKFKHHTIAATIECGGNRRADMKKEAAPTGSGHRIKGLDWDAGAIGTAQWGGVWLRDVLKAAGLDENDPSVAHIHFFGYDQEPDSGTPYSVSIPITKALSPTGDVLLAYEMNGQPLPRDHGYPVRVVVPGHVGARQVKWLAKVVASAQESTSHWQVDDYKAFSPGTDWDTLDWNSAPAMQEMPVVSAICAPLPGEEVSVHEGEVTVRGYAWSGGGRDIIRVDASLDGGKTWQQAQLRKLQQPQGRAWAWSLWEATLQLPPGHTGPLTLACKATDSAYNTQPDDPRSIWNIRGMGNNSWHKVTITVTSD